MALRELRKRLREPAPIPRDRHRLRRDRGWHARRNRPLRRRGDADDRRRTMTNKTWMLVTMVAMAMGAMGCAGSAHVVRRGAYSGELALTGGSHASMDAAQMAMLEHCGGRVRIVSEDEARTFAAVDPSIAKSEGASVAIEGERLHYVCVSLASAAR
jgi:hypothetical protein